MIYSIEQLCSVVILKVSFRFEVNQKQSRFRSVSCFDIFLKLYQENIGRKFYDFSLKLFLGRSGKMWRVFFFFFKKRIHIRDCLFYALLILKLVYKRMLLIFLDRVLFIGILIAFPKWFTFIHVSSILH